VATKARKGTATKVGKGKVRGNGEGGVWQIPANANRHAGKWRCTVELGYKADGTRIRRNLIAASKAEILVKLAAAQSEALAPPPTAPKDLSVAQFLADWLETLELAGKAPRTIVQRRSFTRLYLVPEIGRVKLVDLKPEDVEKMLGRLSTRPGRPLSPRTLQLVRCILGTALTRAEKFGYVTRNAAKQSTAPKSTSKKRDGYTADEVKLLLRTAGGSRMGRVVELIALTGLRRGELGALRWSNVNFDRGLITVDGTLGKDRSIGATKTRSSQGSISLPASAVELLRRHATRPTT
jgi:integrase